MWRRSVTQIPRTIARVRTNILLAKPAHEHRGDGSNAASPFDAAGEQ